MAQKIDSRVVVLTHYLPPYMARVLFHVGQQVRELQILLSIDQEPNRQFGNTWEGLNVRIQKSWMLRRPWKHGKGFTDELYIHIPYDTFSQLRRAKPNIVFSYELGFRSLLSALYCKLHRKRLAICVCASEHTEKGRGYVRPLVRRILLKSADAITYNGPSCRSYLKRFGVPDKKLFHFPYATSDLFQYTAPVKRPPTADHRLICIGQLTERKGVLPMIDTLSSYCRARPERQVEIDLVGEGKLHSTLEAMELPANLQLRLLGHMSYEEMAKAISQAGVLIFPTLADEWGLVVNEAMQSGLPVLGSVYAQASTTLISENENGWLYRPEVPEQLHEKLDRLFATPPERMTEMRHCAQRTVSHITSDSAAAQALKMLQSLAEPAG